MILLPCPFLNGPVRLSAEREAHILFEHRDLSVEWPRLLAQVLTDPDEIRWSSRRAGTLVFGRWYPALLRGKYVLVAVVLDATGRQEPWIVTAYVARRWRSGAVAWRRS
jgi:hypothetical protein